MKKTVSDSKMLGQVFTPPFIVEDILDAAGYFDKNILKKHVMENSCGDGVFLCEIIKRYILAYRNTYFDNDAGLICDIEQYIHGIEKDPDTYRLCLLNIEETLSIFGLHNVKMDVICEDTLNVTKYNEKMDFVVGNPPYIRVHNLENNYDGVKQFNFSQRGMTDIFIVFFEIGFNMLKNGGTLSYITPNSYYGSLAGKELRKYIKKTKSMYKILDLGHYNPFPVVTYTTISCFQKGSVFDSVIFESYNNEGKSEFIANIEYEKLFIKDKIFLIDPKKNDDFSVIFCIEKRKYPQICVKNGFATLADSIFIQDSFDFESKNIIPVIKASTGEWKQCIYPYSKNGDLINFIDLDPCIRQYLDSYKDNLEKRSLDRRSPWYSFGRTQAISDVCKNKIAISILVKDIDSIKIERVDAGRGVYSGLYILSDYEFEEIERVIKTSSFIDYIKRINKCKNGGYFTFSSDDLNKYLIFKLCDVKQTQSTLF